MTMVTNLYIKAFNLVVALALALMVQTSALAAGGAHWNQNTQGAPSNSPFLTVGNDVNLDQNRPLTSSTSSFLKFTDYGAKMNYQLEFDTAPLPILRGGTGAASQQAGLNNLMSLSGVTAGDIIYYDGVNWSLIHKGANSTVFGVNGGGTVGYYLPSGSGTVTNFVASAGSWPAWLVPSVATATSTPTLSVAAGTGLTAYYVVGTDASGNVVLGALTASHIPNISAAKITSGNLAKAQHATSAVFNDQSNTYTGTFTQDHSASGQTLVIPVKAAGTTTGEIALNSTDLEFRSAGVTNKTAKQATTISTTSPLSGGGDLSANRTLTLGTVDTSKGGTGLTSFTAGDTLYYASGTTLSKVAIGANGTVWKSNGTAPSWGTVGGGFAGDGSAGSVTKGAVTETTVLQLNSSSFTQTVSTTWAPLSGTIVNATSTCAFNGTTNVGYGCLGGLGATQATAYPSRGSGPGGGSGGVNTGESGGGGSNAGDGGRAGSSFANTYTEKTKSYPMCRLGGSGGGGGVYASSAGGDGGKGGGVLIACAVGAMTVGASGTINADGQAGAAATGSGGGGGAGGTVSLNSQTSIANSGSILCRGGAGGNSTSGAGGATGGGGYIQFVSPSNTNGTRTVTAGATIGTGGTQVPTVGSAGLAVSITATPNLPLLLSMQEDNFARMKSIALAHRVLNLPAREGFDVELTMREAATACSRGSVIQFAKLVDGNMTESTCLEIGDHIEDLLNAA